MVYACEVLVYPDSCRFASITALQNHPDRYDESKQQSYGVLTLKNPTIVGDAGEYYCTAFWKPSNATNISSKKAYWSLYGIELKPAIGIIGHAATMTCVVSTISQPDAVSWYRQGNYLPVQPKPTYKVTCLFNLVFLGFAERETSLILL
jgi:hypothetical protein